MSPSLPLAELQLSKSSIGLFGVILEQAFEASWYTEGSAGALGRRLSERAGEVGEVPSTPDHGSSTPDRESLNLRLEPLNLRLEPLTFRREPLAPDRGCSPFGVSGSPFGAGG